MEKSATDSDVLNLIFTSQGVPLEEEENLGGLEIMLRIKFKSDTRREMFLEMVMRTQTSLMTEYDGEFHTLRRHCGAVRLSVKCEGSWCC